MGCGRAWSRVVVAGAAEPPRGSSGATVPQYNAPACAVIVSIVKANLLGLETSARQLRDELNSASGLVNFDVNAHEERGGNDE
ncbi:unnamed protein product [Arctia plantaginis]|uniref:Uncharacterized protein n=1 Tax=Arctia plantaginis TaxID=874455 RepID=A0A8S0ZRK1_ARCPL|nr:unnamed protein product [Arctia plantaginis]